MDGRIDKWANPQKMPIWAKDTYIHNLMRSIQWTNGLSRYPIRTQPN